MSRQLISRSPDLQELQADGYEIAVVNGHLVLFNVPYVTEQGDVDRGHLVSALEMAGDVTRPPSDHIVMFTGGHPCDAVGHRLARFDHGTQCREIADGIVAERSFSCKPAGGYTDYRHKMATYAEMISASARKIEPGATARTHAVVEVEDPGSVFHYADTASGRAGITSLNRKLKVEKLVIVGLGGTGSYILDLLAKTPACEIHLIDGDDFLQHNAFRAPGAASRDELRAIPKKVDYYAAKYAPMRRGIVPHPVFLDESNLELLDGAGFVFICLDDSDAKAPIIEKLESEGVSFIDTGMGLTLADDKLFGVVRVTTSTPRKRDHVTKRVPMNGTPANDVYDENVQTADLNALNAILAVLKYKKLREFYGDLEQEHTSNYTLDGNLISNVDTTS